MPCWGVLIPQFLKGQTHQHVDAGLDEEPERHTTAEALISPPAAPWIDGSLPVALRYYGCCLTSWGCFPLTYHLTEGGCGDFDDGKV